jgi:hypothetical protein
MGVPGSDAITQCPHQQQMRWSMGPICSTFVAQSTTARSVLGSDIDLIGSPMPNRPLLIRRTGIRIRIVASHGRVIAVRVLRAIPSRVVARITETETITKVVAKKNAAEAEYGAAPESTKLSIEARIEVPVCERMSSAEVAACERMPPAEVATPTMPAFVSACGHRRLRNPDGERGGGGQVP